MGKAVSYALSQWESLEVYLKEPEIEIDNNLVENAIRPTALGKNYEQSGIRQSLKRLSVILSMGIGYGRRCKTFYLCIIRAYRGSLIGRLAV
jgi:Transposase IS66 family